jgi:hypothetical protein
MTLPLTSFTIEVFKLDKKMLGVNNSRDHFIRKKTLLLI